MLKLLLAHDAAVEYWERGHLRTVQAGQTPRPETLRARLLYAHRRRFQRAAAPTATVDPSAPAPPRPWLVTQDAHTLAWLARAGRFAQPQAAGAVPCEVKAMLVVDHQVPLPAAQALLGHLGADHGCLREKMGQVHARFRSDRVQAHHHVLCAFLNHKLVAQFNFLGDRYAILIDQRGPVRPLKNNIASLGTKLTLTALASRLTPATMRLRADS